VRYGEALLATNENPMSRVLQGMIYAKMGDTAQALGNVAQSLAADPQHPVLLFFAAQARALMGLRREALDTLKAAVENGFFNLPMIEFLTRPGMSFHILRNDPDFHAIRADLARRIDALRSRY
jgi:tetratricopeptide (TPR) repeat protein